MKGYIERESERWITEFTDGWTQTENIPKNKHCINRDPPTQDRQHPDFVQGLVTTLAEHCIDGLGGPVAEVKLKEEPFTDLCMDVLKSLDLSTEEEMQCIFAIQMLATK